MSSWINATGDYKDIETVKDFYGKLTVARPFFMKNDLYTGLPFFCQYVFMRLGFVKMLTKLNRTKYEVLNDMDAKIVIDAGLQMTKVVPKRFRNQVS